jgi:integrase
MARKRRAFTAHRGVVILRRELPSGRATYRARWTDPETGKARFQSLDAIGLYSPAERAAWARERAEQNRQEKAALAAGTRRPARALLAGAVADYLEACRATLRPATLTTYATSLGVLLEWAVEQGIERVDELDGPALARLGAYLIARPRHGAKREGRRGEKRASGGTRGARTVARDSRQIGGFLRHAIRHGLAPRLTRDAISDALKPPRGEKKLPQFLGASEVRALIDAALRHDAATYAATREEHAGEREPGSTPRYKAIAPAVVLALLTGMRRGELVALTWADVDLGAVDEQGREVGELRVRAAVAKTRTERKVDLAVSPAARALLGALKLRAGRSASVLGLTDTELESAGRRLRGTFGAPAAASWHALRRTCATYLCNSNIFGGATAWRAAKQLGHGVQVLEKHYAGLISVSRDARSIEDAMQCAELVAQVVGAAAGEIARRGAAVTA